MEKQLTGYPSIDKPWLKYFTEEDLNFKAPLCTVYKNIYDQNKDYLQDTALIFFGHKICFGRLFREVERSARALKSAGIKKETLSHSVLLLFQKLFILYLPVAELVQSPTLSIPCSPQNKWLTE